MCFARPPCRLLCFARSAQQFVIPGALAERVVFLGDPVTLSGLPVTLRI